MYETFDRLTEEQEEYAWEFSQTGGDIEEAYRRTHKAEKLSRAQLKERAINYFISVFGDALRERWEATQ